jgi:hypothetical protein
MVQDPKSFNIEDPVSDPLVFIPSDTEPNYSNQPLPPPRASYKRATEDIGDNEVGVTSEWNFVLP